MKIDKDTTVTINGMEIEAIPTPPPQFEVIKLDFVVEDLNGVKWTPSFAIYIRKLLGDVVARLQEGRHLTFGKKTITLDNIWRDWLVEVANRLDAVSECWDLLCRYHPDLQNSSNEELLRKFNETCKK